jgi:hypothetical protein
MKEKMKKGPKWKEIERKNGIKDDQRGVGKETWKQINNEEKPWNDRKKTSKRI